DVAPVPAPQIGSRLIPEFVRLQLGAKCGEDRDQSEAREPLLVEDSEPVFADMRGQLESPLDRTGRTAPVVLEPIRREIDEDARLRVEIPEERKGSENEHTELVLVSLSVRPRTEPRMLAARLVPEIVKLDSRAV